MMDFPSPIPTAAPLCTQSYKSRKIDEVYLFNYKNKMSPKEIFSKLSLWIVNLYPKSYVFCRNIFHVWIRIRIQNTDPDLHSSWIRIQYRSGYTTLRKIGTGKLYKIFRQLRLSIPVSNQICTLTTRSIQLLNFGRYRYSVVNATGTRYQVPGPR